MGRLRDWIEKALPWYQPGAEAVRDVQSARVVRHAEVARERASRVIAEYRRAEDVADRAGVRTAAAVSEFRDAQEGAREAGERLIDEVERPSDAE